MKEMKDMRSKLTELLQKNNGLESEIKKQKKVILAYESNDMNLLDAQTMIDDATARNSHIEPKKEDIDLNASGVGNITQI